MTFLVTGSAGFIGFHITKRLIEKGYKVIGIDNFNDYYDINLKIKRVDYLDKLKKNYGNNFININSNIENKEEIKRIFNSYKPKKVIHLAAQAGVRYSIKNPSAYISSNIVGFSNILEECRNFKVDHFVFASSSSVYGGNTKLPFSEKDAVNHPISLYAASKKSNEIMAHSYSHLFNLPVTGLRFFTVYGPWGRPDMALFKFTRNIIENKKIEIYNNGEMKRDFTYIDDVVECIVKIIFKIPQTNNNFNTEEPDNSSSWAPFKILNIGNSKPIKLLEYINAIEKETGIKAHKNFLPLQPGDVIETYSDTSEIESWIGFKPNTSIEKGIHEFVKWYKDFYCIN